MKKGLLVIIFALHFVLAHGQVEIRQDIEKYLYAETRYPDHCKFIKQFKDGKLVRVSEFDKNKKLVAHTDSEFNSTVFILPKSDGTVDKRVTISYKSTLGFTKSMLTISIESFNYDLNGCQTDSYTKVKRFDEFDSSLFNYTGREELMRNPKVLATLASTEIDSRTLNRFNQKGAIESEISINSKGDTTVTKTYQYNGHNQKSKVFTRMSARFGGLANSQSFEYSDNFPTKISRQSDNETGTYSTNTYDEKGQLIEVRYYNKDQFIHSTKNTYNQSGRVEASYIFRETADKPYSTTLNFFDNQGRLTKSICEYPESNTAYYFDNYECMVKKVEVNNQTKKAATTNYSYEIGYF